MHRHNVLLPVAIPPVNPNTLIPFSLFTTKYIPKQGNNVVHNGCTLINTVFASKKFTKNGTKLTTMSG